MTLDDIIDFSLEVFCRLFKIDLNWVLAELDINTPEELKKAISMAYDDAEKCIIVNPFIWEQYKDEKTSDATVFHIIFSLVGHECRHAWQHQDVDYSKEWKEYKTYIKTKGDYLHQKVEIDAYAFQEACYWIISNEMNHHLTVPEEAANVIHSLAVKHYYEYKNPLKSILKEVIKNVS